MNNYRIAWKVLETNKSGHGETRYTKSEAELLVRGLNDKKIKDLTIIWRAEKVDNDN